MTMTPVLSTPSAGPGQNASPQLKKAAQEFEGMLLATLWKSMRQSFGPDQEEEGADAGADSLKDIGTQALCTGIAAGGGLGIGNLLLRRLGARQSDANSDPNAARDLAKGSSF